MFEILGWSSFHFRKFVIIQKYQNEAGFAKYLEIS